MYSKESTCFILNIYINISACFLAETVLFFIVAIDCKGIQTRRFLNFTTDRPEARITSCYFKSANTRLRLGGMCEFRWETLRVHQKLITLVRLWSKTVLNCTASENQAALDFEVMHILQTPSNKLNASLQGRTMWGVREILTRPRCELGD